MRRYHLRRAIRAAQLSRFEEHALLGGLLMLVAGIVCLFVAGDEGRVGRVIGSAGLIPVGLAAASHAGRRYRAAVTASLPTSVARVRVRTRPARGFGLVTFVLAILLPLAAAVAVVVLVEPGWLLLATVVLLGCAGAIAAAVEDARDPYRYEWSSDLASGLLERLCMRAGMRAPELVVEHGPTATAWTARGRIHVTSRLLKLLDDVELEAVLAHEVAHIAHRDAVVMEICSGPSRVLLAFPALVLRWTRNAVAARMPRTTAVTVALGALCGPPALVVGWISRLSVLGMSRAREFSADAAAATLTGRPSALVSALLKLDRQREWTPRSDLRQVEARAVLCIVGAGGSRLDRLFSTHPPVAARVKRLEETEIRIQAASHPGRLAPLS